NSVEQLFPNVEGGAQERAASGILSNGTQVILRNKVVADPDLIGQTITVAVPVSDPFDQLNKGVIDRNLPEDRRRVSNFEIELFSSLEERGLVSTPINFGLVFNADSRFPELAGLAGAI